MKAAKPSLLTVAGPYASDEQALMARLLLVRRFEERVAELFSKAAVPGDVHLSIGQEAVAVGVCAYLRSNDVVAGSHRAHHIALAKGVELVPLLAELMGRAQGLCRGKGGSMHITSRKDGFLGAYPIVGAATPLVVGAALTAKRSGGDDLAAVFFGDGALNQGLTLEALNLAAVWKLPVLFVAENNQWAETTSVADAFAIDCLADRGTGFGIASQSVDGQDLDVVLAAAGEAITAIRQGNGPQLIECRTERFRGHYEGDPGGYRTREEERQVRQRDPLTIFARSRGLETDWIERLDSSVVGVLDDAVERALAMPPPAPDELLADIFAEPTP
jgi:pyruvate dehydrogenase E1 component alpha subunit